MATTIQNSEVYQITTVGKNNAKTIQYITVEGKILQKETILLIGITKYTNLDYCVQIHREDPYTAWCDLGFLTPEKARELGHSYFKEEVMYPYRFEFNLPSGDIDIISPREL